MTEEIKKPKIHARFSPSTLDGLKNCLRFRFDRTKTMDSAADEGTLLHYSLETGCDDGLDEYQRIDVTKARDYVNSVKASLAPGYVELKEPKLILHELTFGHSDLVLIDVTNYVAHVLDYKFIRVSGDHDFQTRTYGAAVVEMLTPEHGLHLDDGRILHCPITRVVTHVVAPRLAGPVETHEFVAQQLLKEVREELEALYADIDDPFLPPNPEFPELCARCERCARCPAVNKTVALAAPKLGLPMPEVFEPDSIVSTSDRALAQKLAGLFEKWSEQVKRANTAFVVAGGEIPGFKLTTRNNGFTIPRESTLTAVELLKGAFGLEAEQILGSMKISVPELAEQLAAVTTDSEDAWKSKLVAALQSVGRSGTSQFLTKVSKADMKKALKQ